MKDMGKALDEFQSHFLTVMNRSLPCYSDRETDTYVSTAISYLSGSQIDEHALEIQTLLNEVRSKNRPQFIKDIKTKFHATSNFY